jgi:hypothetical protein
MGANHATSQASRCLERIVAALRRLILFLQELASDGLVG